MSFSCKGMTCILCPRIVDYIGHHFKSKGAGGKDTKENLLNLCSEHHTTGTNSVHRLGTKTFVERNPKVKKWLLEKGWEYCSIAKKWYVPHNKGET